MRTNPPALQRLAERLAADVAAQRMQLGECGTAPVSRYLTEDWLAQERAKLFRAKPVILAHASELPESGACLRHDALGVPLLLTRDKNGALHGFLNVCRHRGMRLMEDNTCVRKTLVCPYHGWTYELSGQLRHVPHAEVFDGLDAAKQGLREIPVAERAGLIWGIAQPDATMDLDAWLGPIADELEFFGLGDAAIYRRTDVVRNCNWKLVIEAFLEAYHIRVLHRDTIYRFFLDSAAASDLVPPHVRSVAARRRITEAAGAPEHWDLRELCTFTYFVFPNSVFIFHPDYSSLITLYPLAPNRTRWVHSMLVPAALNTEEHRPHWEKTYELIEQGVFQREDLFAAEGIQAGMDSGANDTLRFGQLEFLLTQFHRSIEQELAA